MSKGASIKSFLPALASTMVFCAVLFSGRAWAQLSYQPYSISTLAGVAGSSGSVDGPTNEARFASPMDVAVDGAGNVYVAATYSDAIRRIGFDGTVSTLAGLPGSPGSADGTNSAARFNKPRGICLDPEGNVFVADTGNHTVRKLSAEGTN